MTISKITIVALSAFILAACGSSKKSSTPATAEVSIIPGDAQLTAIKQNFLMLQQIN